MRVLLRGGRLDADAVVPVVAEAVGDGVEDDILLSTALSECIVSGARNGPVWIDISLFMLKTMCRLCVDSANPPRICELRLKLSAVLTGCCI